MTLAHNRIDLGSPADWPGIFVSRALYQLETRKERYFRLLAFAWQHDRAGLPADRRATEDNEQTDVELTAYMLRGGTK